MSFMIYVGIQVLAYVVDMGGFLVVLKAGLVGPIAANVISKIGAGAFAFVAHRNLTFGTNARQDRNHQAVRYAILLLLNVPLTSALLAVILTVIDNPVYGKFSADVIGVGLTYWLSKHFVFIKKKASLQPTRNDTAGSED